MASHPNHRPAATLPAELRRTSVPERVREWVRAACGAHVVRVQRLPGASSAALHRLDLADGTRLVLRRYVWRAYLAAEPEAPGREGDALAFAARRGLPVPEVVAADPTGDDVGDGVPAILTTFVPGRPIAVPDLPALAEVAASVHAVDADDLGHEYFPWYEDAVSGPPAGTERPDLWETAIGLWRDGRPSYRPTLVHRDLHPGNLLWRRGRLTGIVDWANACRGPAGCDVAHCRANLRDLAGPDVADAFVAAYEATTGEVLDPFWIVAGHLEHDAAHWTPARLAADEPDLARAVQAITG